MSLFCGQGKIRNGNDSAQTIRGIEAHVVDMFDAGVYNRETAVKRWHDIVGVPFLHNPETHDPFSIDLLPATQHAGAETYETGGSTAAQPRR